jgi:phytoene synthase
MTFRLPAIRAIARNIFKKGSTTYYYSSLFFPASIRHAVFTFYAYVRVADDLVDSIPQNISGFEDFCKESSTAFKNKPAHNKIILAFRDVTKEYDIPYKWIESFLKAMRADTQKSTYKKFKELEEYMYGSAEVIGLVMAKILKLPKESYQYAQLQGKAMQLINFIRDVDEDIKLGRTYIPLEDLNKFGLKDLNIQTDQEKEAFSNLIKFEIKRYRNIQKQAEKGYQFMPITVLIPVKTAADIYNWTADEIEKNPLIVFERKVKPNPAHVLSKVFVNYFTA